MSISEDAHNSHMQVSESEEDNRSITQWYKENLFTQKLNDGDENENKDDDNYNNINDEDDNPLCGILDNSILDNSILGSESDGEAEKGEELPHLNRSTTTSGKQASNKGKARDDNDDDEDGYSSPLEGFWDLRCSTQGSSLERDILGPRNVRLLQERRILKELLCGQVSMIDAAHRKGDQEQVGLAVKVV
ncbi:hypothetical protein GGI22_001705 [Coemansia erecta]|nr:hypothetical protein GGI22_001705 [Coemansia erecta]